MKISNHNYEEYIADYLDNKLSNEQKSDFEAFLLQNPEIQELMNDFLPIVEAENIKFENKKDLYWKETITNSELNDQLIGLLENQLDEQSKTKINALIETDAAISKTFTAYTKTILKPDYRIQFSEKKMLYRQTSIYSTLYRTMAMAASLALLLFLTLNPTQKNTNKPIAEMTWQFEMPKISLSEIYQPNEAIVYKKNAETLAYTVKSNKKIKNTNTEETDNSDSLRISDIELLAYKENHFQQKKPEAKNTVSSPSFSSGFVMSENKPEIEKHAGWALAEKALNKIHSFTKKGIILDNEYTIDGQIARLVIVSENFKYEREFTVE